MTAHQTQFRLKPDVFPIEILRESFGREYFIRVEPSQGAEWTRKGDMPIAVSLNIYF